MYRKDEWFVSGGRFHELWNARFEIEIKDEDTRHMKYICRDIKKCIKSDSSRPEHRISLTFASDLILGAAKLLSRKATIILEELKSDLVFGDISDSEDSTGVEHIVEDTIAGDANVTKDFLQVKIYSEQSGNRVSEKCQEEFKSDLVSENISDSENSTGMEHIAKDTIVSNANVTKDLLQVKIYSEQSGNCIFEKHQDSPHATVGFSVSHFSFNRSIYETYEKFMNKEFTLQPLNESELPIKRKKRRIFKDKKTQLPNRDKLMISQLDQYNITKIIPDIHIDTVLDGQRFFSSTAEPINLQRLHLRKSPRIEMNYLEKQMLTSVGHTWNPIGHSSPINANNCQSPINTNNIVCQRQGTRLNTMSLSADKRMVPPSVILDESVLQSISSDEESSIILSKSHATERESMTEINHDKFREEINDQQNQCDEAAHQKISEDQSSTSSEANSEFWEFIKRNSTGEGGSGIQANGTSNLVSNKRRASQDIDQIGQSKKTKLFDTTGFGNRILSNRDKEAEDSARRERRISEMNGNVAFTIIFPSGDNQHDLVNDVKVVVANLSSYKYLAKFLAEESDGVSDSDN